MKNNEFHIPFIKNLVFIGIVTIVSMVSVHYFFHNMFLQSSNTLEYTSQQSNILEKSSK
jgi:hypothetical protein